MAIGRDRVEWLDSAKGILILLVVLGHVIGSCARMMDGTEYLVCGFVFKAIYLFHMPAFFFLAGLTFNGCSFIAKMKRLLVPYFSFGIISIVVYQVALWPPSLCWWHPWASLLYGAPFPGTDGFRCNSVLWFLPCLFSSTCLWGLVQKLVSWSKHQLICKLIIATSSVVAFVSLNKIGWPTLPYGLSLFLKYLPFFIAGNLLSSSLLRPSQSVGRKTMMVLWFCMVVYVAALFFVSNDWDMYSVYWKWIVAVIVGLMGTLGCCVASMKVDTPVLRMFGVSSIGIMMTHKWIVLAFNRMGIYNVLIVFFFAAVCSFMMTILVRKFVPWMLGEFRK